MARDKQQYLERVSDYQCSIDTILEWEVNALFDMPTEPIEVVFKKLTLTNQMLDLTSLYIVLSEISMAMIELKNDDALNHGRKSLGKALSYLEDIVSPYIDSPLSDYQDKLELIDKMSARQRYFLVRKLGLTIDLLKNSYGDNSKWRWTFVDIEGRFAVVTKNVFDMRNAIVNLEPRSPNYVYALPHMRLIKKLLGRAADRYREKYELSTKVADDFKKGIEFLIALRRLHTVLGESSDAELAKRKTDVWNAKLQSDIKLMEAENKGARK
jgi:hypothetical protein